MADGGSCQNNSEKSEIPIFALRTKTRTALSQLLNPIRIIPSPEGLPRDWRGLAHLAEIACPSRDVPDPTGAVLTLWQKTRPLPNLLQLEDFLGRLDRWDVIDDTAALIALDIEEYAHRKENGATPNCALVEQDFDSDVLTVDDIYRIEQGFGPIQYDAFLLFADEDEEFAKLIVDKLENSYNLKLCLRDRDLVGGLWFEHEAIMTLIADRCRRLIIIISPSFLESKFNKFFVTYAQALGIEQRQRKIVPCVYHRFQLPPQLRHYFVLDYNRAGQFWDFWEKLSQSVSSHPTSQRCPQMNLKATNCPSYKMLEGCKTAEASGGTEDKSECKQKVNEKACGILTSGNSLTDESRGTGSAKGKHDKGATSKVRNKTLSLSILQRLLPSPPTSPLNSDQRPKSKSWFKKRSKVT